MAHVCCQLDGIWYQLKRKLLAMTTGIFLIRLSEGESPILNVFRTSGRELASAVFSMPTVGVAPRTHWIPTYIRG